MYRYEIVLGQHSSLEPIHEYGYLVLADFRGLEIADKTDAKGSD